MSNRVPQDLTPAARITGARAYAVPREAAAPTIDLWLDANEGTVPPPAHAKPPEGDSIDIIRRYPSPRAFEQTLARHFGVADDQVIVTAGIDDALYRACMTMLEPGRNIVLTTPTFEMIARYARLAGGEVRQTPWWDRPYPVEDMLELADEQTALVAFVTPNNPTGGAATATDLAQLSDACPHALILADFAYSEFADVAMTSAALRLSNVLVLRTFSKAWGLAGLRVGYAIGPASVIAWLRAAGSPYAVSGPSLALASAALRAGPAYVDRFVAVVKHEREALHELLAQLGAAPLPSQANFVMARFGDALAVWRGLAQRGISVRAFPNRGELEHYLRITCPGEAAAFTRLTNALKECVDDTQLRSER